jgi:hypothetical protein
MRMVWWASHSSYMHCPIMQSGLLGCSVQGHGIRGSRMQRGCMCCNGSRRSVVHTPSRDTRHGVTANVATKCVGTYAGSRKSMSTASGMTSATAAPCVTSATDPAGGATTSTATGGSGGRQGRR